MKNTKFKNILLAFILSFSFNGHALEMSEKNLKKLSQVSDDSLFKALIFTDYKLSAIDRRNEALEGVLPVKYDENSLKILQQTYASSQESKKLYDDALAAIEKDLPEEIYKSCKKTYNFKKMLPEIMKSSFANVVSFKKNPIKYKVLGAQEWTRLQLLKNYYLNSISSYASGEVVSMMMGIGARCFNDDKLYKELIDNDSEMLESVDKILNQIIGQPGLRSEGTYSKILADQFVENSSLLNQSKRMAKSIAIDTAIYFAGYGLVKYGVTALIWTPKIYKYVYPAIYGAVQGAVNANGPEAIGELNRGQAVTNNLVLFEKRLRTFISDQDNLYAQMGFAMEMEEILFLERLDLAQEAMKLCNGKCTQEQATQLREKFNRNKSEILHVLKGRHVLI